MTALTDASTLDCAPTHCLSAAGYFIWYYYSDKGIFPPQLVSYAATRLAVSSAGCCSLCAFERERLLPVFDRGTGVRDHRHFA